LASRLAVDHCDTTLTNLGIDKKRFSTVAKRQILLPEFGSSSGSKKKERVGIRIYTFAWLAVWDY